MQDNITVEKQMLSGTVEHVTFRNSATGFTVIELDCKGESITAVGVMPEISNGELLELTGYFDIHSTYGHQFKVDVCEHALPSGTAAILKYLSGGAIKGIGPSTAKRIVKEFGEKTFEILENQPDQLAMIKGITQKKAKQISEEFTLRSSIREVVLKLSQIGISGDEAINVYKKFGQKSIEKITEDPYRLCSNGIEIPFERVDDIARKMHFGVDCLERITAGLNFILTHNLLNGHTCIPKDKLLKVAANMLECNTFRADEACEELLNQEIFKNYCANGKDYIFLSDYFDAECFIAQRIALLNSCFSSAKPVDEQEIEVIEASIDIKYAALQKQAISLAIENGCFILTGGPGTGKTTTLRAIIKVMENRGMEFALAAPTGRAAKRMTELTGYEAKTIHRLLEVEWSNESGKHTYARNEKNPLNFDAIIVDELSMVDVLLFESILRALRLGCRLILVGDSDQLPSVGAGNVLHDLLDSGVVSSACLSEVFRQAKESLIVINAHNIVAGNFPELDCNNNDFFLIEQQNPRAAAELLSDLCVRRLPCAYNYSSFDNIQVLCPSKKMDLGTVNLNNILQSKLNPPKPNIPEVHFRGFVMRPGDKVMQIKNNYDIIWSRDNGEVGAGVFNGDIGILETVNNSEGTVSVKFDDRVAVYTGDEVAQLELAYAITIHKSQGSEFDCVVIPILDMPAQLRYRNLLYTAVTRAKKMLIIVGSKNVVNKMVENNKKTLRYTALCELLKEINTNE